MAQPGASAVWKATTGFTNVMMSRSGEVCAPPPPRWACAEATRRDAIDAELRDLAVENGRMPAVTKADPQADAAAQLARWLTAGFLPITPDDVAMARIAGMVLLPQDRRRGNGARDGAVPCAGQAATVGSRRFRPEASNPAI